MAYVIRRPHLRQGVQMCLGRLVEKHRSRVAAAGIAGLVGDCSPSAALREGRSRFRTIYLHNLSFADMADNTPNQNLFTRSKVASLGEADAFISHSWHEDATAKWTALQLWHGVFAATHGREPRLWIDKCCIDQRNIDVDLRCLPVFLVGCERLVVLCGPTYLNRLWCIVEIFTYVHTGGQICDIELLPVLKQDRKEEDTDAIKAAFNDFDARMCRCYNPADKEKILTIIHTAFGSMSGFNIAVRTILENVSERRDSSSSLSYHSSGSSSD